MKKKNIFISGGSSEIGSQIILDLANKAKKIFVTYNNNYKTILKLKKKLKKKKINNIFFFKLDISDLTSVEKFCKYFFKKNKISLIINNAAIIQRKKFQIISIDDWNKILGCNLVGPFLFAKYAILFKKKKDILKIINISSIAAKVGGIEQPHYAASKAGLSNLSKSISRIFPLDNIFSFTINPGVIDTKSISKKKKNKNSKLINSIPIRRLGKPSEVSNLVCYLYLSKTDYMTGSEIDIQGGMI